MPGINEKLLNSIEMPVIPPYKQAEIVHSVEELNQVEETLLNGIGASASLSRALANALTSQG
jgi:hypothetical protein